MPALQKTNLTNGKPPSEICRELVNDHGVKRVALSFSAGKDSIAAWLCLREAGIEVVPFYFSIFPVELEIEKRIVGFYEDFFKTDVHVYPHPCCYEIFTELLFMGPAQVRVMELIGVRDVRSMKWIDSHASESLNPGGFTVYGLKKSDSFNRACVLNKGHINTKLRKAYPMAYCGDRAVFSLLQAHGCPLPDCYAEIGESLDSFRIPTMDYIRRKSPSDWETIKQLQPLIELEYARQRISTRH